MRETTTEILTESSCLVRQIGEHHEEPSAFVDKIKADAGNDGIAYLSCAVESRKLVCRARAEDTYVLVIGNLNKDDCQIYTNTKQ